MKALTYKGSQNQSQILVLLIRYSSLDEPKIQQVSVLAKREKPQKRFLQTSADARNILASACLTEIDSFFVSPKSSKIGR